MTSRAWAAFAAVSLLWGIPYLFIKIAVDDGVSPGFVSWSRVALAAAVMVPLAWRAGALAPMRKRWKPLLAFAFFEITVPFPLIAVGEQHISSGLTAILIASMPLIVAVIALKADPSDRLDRWRVGGMLVGLSGVVFLFGIDIAGDTDELFGAGCILVATVGYAIGPLVVSRYLGDLDPRGPVAGALLLAMVLLAPAAILGAPTEMPTTDAIASIVVLGLACTAAAFVFMFILVREAGPNRSSIITYINPVVAVALGVAVLGEPVGLGAAVGMVLILLGSWLATGSGGPPAGLGPLLGRRRRSAA